MKNDYFDEITEEDFYDPESLGELLDDDEISSAEEGFMHGYNVA